MENNTIDQMIKKLDSKIEKLVELNAKINVVTNMQNAMDSKSNVVGEK